MTVTILKGDCREVLRTLPADSVHCCVTSPPYFGLRDYGVAGQIGLEPSPTAFIDELVAVFAEVRRVLRADGTLWLNLGDSYSTHAAGKVADPMRASTLAGASKKTATEANRVAASLPNELKRGGLPEKNLLGIPWLAAFALRNMGWYLRQDIIWSKPNPMPESVTDRCTKAHEYLFLLSKSERYYYDAEAIAEALAGEPHSPGNIKLDASRNDHDQMQKVWGMNGKRNKRSVWSVTSQPFPEAHFATFPPALIEPCIKAGCPEKVCAKCGAPWVRQVERTAMVIDRSDRTHERGQTRSSGTMIEPPRSITLGFSPGCDCAAPMIGGTVLDPFGGAGTTGLVADRLGRNAVLIELNPEYAAMAERRIKQDAGMFAQVAAE